MEVGNTISSVNLSRPGNKTEIENREAHNRILQSSGHKYDTEFYL